LFAQTQLTRKNVLTHYFSNKIISGLTKTGEVGEILALYQLKSPSKAKLKSPCFFLQVALFLQIICILW
jgi:hypothetical protein